MYSVGSIVANLGVRDAQFHAAFARANARMGAFEKGVQARSASMAAGLMSMMKIAGGFGLALAGGATMAVKKFASFDASMRNVNTIAREGEEQFRKTSMAVLDMSTMYAQGSKDMADALYNINSASFSGAEGLAVLDAAAKAGRAGVSDTATAAAGITAVLNAYGLSASEAGDVSDIMFKTVEKGVLTFGELSSNIGTVISSAAMVGVSFDQVGAAMATITKGGINSAEAATALNRFMMKLIEGGPELNKIFKDMGYESAKAAVETDGLGKVLSVILDATKGDAKAIQDLGFEMRSFKAVASLGRQEGKAFAEDLAAIADKSSRAGSTQAAFTEQTKALSFQFQQFGTTVGVVMVKVGEKLAPFVSTYLSPITQALMDVSESFDFFAVNVEINARKMALAFRYPLDTLMHFAFGLGEMATWIWSWWKIQFDFITGAFSAVYNSLKATMQGIFDLVAGTWSNIWDVMTMKKGIGAAMESVSHIMTQGMGNAMKTTMEEFSQFGGGMMKETTDLITHAKNKLSGGLRDMMIYSPVDLQENMDSLEEERVSRIADIMAKKEGGFPELTDAVAASVEEGAARGLDAAGVLPTQFAAAAEKGSTEAYSMLRKSEAADNEIKNNTKNTAKFTEEIAKNTRAMEAPSLVAI